MFFEDNQKTDTGGFIVMSRFSFNPFYEPEPSWASGRCGAFTNPDIQAFHQSLAGYTPTPLIERPALARQLGVRALYIKDEAHRFGIKAFKALGASYAIFRYLKREWESLYGNDFDVDAFQDPGKMARVREKTFCAATDGNHGRAVAWTARKLNQRAVIYMPDNTVQARIDNIEIEGARVILVKGTFDDCVARCDADARANDWIAIADIALKEDMEIPNHIMAGYSTLFHELDTLNTPEKPQIDLLLLQAGVGGFAAAGSWFYTHRYGKNRPYLICVEPTESDCLLESIRSGNGAPRETLGKQTSIMAGLNCGTPSMTAWPIIKDAVDAFIAIEDPYAEEAIRAYYYAESGDIPIVSCESGASGLAGLMALCRESALEPIRQRIGLSDCSVLLVNTEGDTDPVNFNQIINASGSWRG
jgi:diaminopropionate ammonia-lyase